MSKKGHDFGIDGIGFSQLLSRVSKVSYIAGISDPDFVQASRAEFGDQPFFIAASDFYDNDLELERLQFPHNLINTSLVIFDLEVFIREEDMHLQRIFGDIDSDNGWLWWAHGLFTLSCRYELARAAQTTVRATTRVLATGDQATITVIATEGQMISQPPVPITNI